MSLDEQEDERPTFDFNIEIHRDGYYGAFDGHFCYDKNNNVDFDNIYFDYMFFRFMDEWVELNMGTDFCEGISKYFKNAIINCLEDGDLDRKIFED